MIWNVLSLLALIAGGLYIVANWGILVECLVKRKHSSWIPIIGGGLGALGCFLSPNEMLNQYWWVPFVIDWGCLPGIAWSLIWFTIWYIRDRMKKEDGNQIRNE